MLKLSNHPSNPNLKFLSSLKFIEMYITTRINNYEGLNYSPLDALCILYRDYLPNSVGGSKGVVIPHLLEDARVLGRQVKFLHFPTSRIYLMVNKANMKCIYDNYKHRKGTKLHYKSLYHKFTISFVSFSSVRASLPDRLMLESNGDQAMCLRSVRHTFVSDEHKHMKDWFKRELGEGLYKEITTLDCLICLSPIAKVFPDFGVIEGRFGKGLLGYDTGGFIVPQVDITSEEGN